MKTERVTILTSPAFKTFLSDEAKREKVSVAELIRTRCEHGPTKDTTLLSELTRALRRSIHEAQHALQGGLLEVHTVLTELRAKHEAESDTSLKHRVASRSLTRKVGARA